MHSVYHMQVLIVRSKQQVSGKPTSVIPKIGITEVDAGAAFCSLLAETLHEINYVPYKADPYVYTQSAVKPNGFEYY